MKIAWFTPFNIQSAIGKYSQIATSALSESMDIDLWVAESSLELHKTEQHIYRYKPDDFNIVRRLDEYDFVVYNFGDNASFHQPIYSVFLMVAGIVILHDHAMFNFFINYFYKKEKDLGKLINSMKLWYGERAGELSRQSFEAKNMSAIWNRDDSINYALFEPLLNNTLGVVTHSEFVKDKIIQKYPGPITSINMPYYGDQATRYTNPNSRDNNNTSSKINLLTIGHVNPNKHIHKVIEAIGTDRLLRNNVHYDVVGNYETKSVYFKSLEVLVAKYKLGGIVKFHSYVEEADLFEFLALADICINLRHPVLNAASWSLIDEFNAAKAVIVSDDSFYSDLPSDVVLKVATGNTEIQELIKTLAPLISSRKLREEYGKKGYDFARNTYTADQYVEKFTLFLKSVKSSKSKMKLLIRSAEELGSFAGRIDEKSLTEIAHRIDQISEISK